MRPLITATELSQVLGNDRWVIIDCRFDLFKPEAGYNAYLAGHIPGSYYAHLEKDLSAPLTANSGRHPLPRAEDFTKTLCTWGIDNATQVVAYDASNGAFACRLWWLLRWLGHNNVAVLNGGMSAWTQAQLPISRDIPVTRSAAQFDLHVDNGYWVSSQFIESNLDNAKFLLIDVRAPERYAGQVEPIDPVAGHIPSAINIPFEQNVDSTGKFLSPTALKAVYSSVFHKVTPRHCAVMCGSGVTACQSIFAMELAGYQGAKLYAGSWSEWIRNPKHPTVQNAPHPPSG